MTDPTTIALARETECLVCWSTRDLRVCALMLPSAPQTVCGDCFIAWYEGGQLALQERRDAALRPVTPSEKDFDGR